MMALASSTHCFSPLVAHRGRETGWPGRTLPLATQWRQQGYRVQLGASCMHPGWTTRGRLEVVKFSAESPASPKFGMAALLSALALGTAPTYSPTPFGLVLAHCVHEVPSGALVDALPDGTRVVSAPDGTRTVLPPCDTKGGEWPIWRASEEGKGGRESAEPNPLPPD